MLLKRHDQGQAQPLNEAFLAERQFVLYGDR
jgi:hypothetical protein